MISLRSHFRRRWAASRSCRLALGLAWLFASPLSGSLHAELTKEYQLKAAFLYNFTRFVEWPEERFKNASDPIVIAVLGSNPFGGELAAVVRDRKVNGRSIKIVELETAENRPSIHALFVPAGEEERLEHLIAALHEAGVLTVGESDRFTRLGGIMRFTTIRDKVRFEINIGSADNGGLKISSQLQKLALAVHKS